MKQFAIAAMLGMTIFTPAFALPVSTLSFNADDTVYHGGGCRKASPPGQCCHAGSQPYHCH